MRCTSFTEQTQRHCQLFPLVPARRIRVFRPQQVIHRRHMVLEGRPGNVVNRCRNMGGGECLRCGKWRLHRHAAAMSTPRSARQTAHHSLSKVLLVEHGGAGGVTRSSRGDSGGDGALRVAEGGARRTCGGLRGAGGGSRRSSGNSYNNGADHCSIRVACVGVSTGCGGDTTVSDDPLEPSPPPSQSERRY